MNFLSTEGLAKEYAQRRGVDGVSIHVSPGEIVGLLGPNGAGKTTTFNMVVGIVRPDEGCVLFEQEEITDLPMHERARAGIGYLTQEPSVFRKLTVKEKEVPITGPMALVDGIMNFGRKGISMQRYKGLGEMNPDQLWETTLDPDVRSLLQVRVSHMDDAEDVFSTLMGDVVEPRRDFIQKNALKVANLDV